MLTIERRDVNALMRRHGLDFMIVVGGKDCLRCKGTGKVEDNEPCGCQNGMQLTGQVAFTLLERENLLNRALYRIITAIAAGKIQVKLAPVPKQTNML